VSSSTRPSSDNTSTSNYDERFVVPLEASRRGAHRARVSPVMAVLPVAAVVGIVIGAIALVYLFLGGMGGSDNAATTVVAPSSASPTAAASTTAGAAAPSSTPSELASGTATGTVDKMLPVAVFNGTQPTVSGLARKASTKLSAAGWTLGRVDTWVGTPVTETTVFYGAEAQRATAMAVAKSLGHGVARLSAASAAKAGAKIVVVVGNDYPTTGLTRPTAMVPHVTATRSSTAGGVATRSPAHTTTKATAKATTKATTPATTSAATTTDTATS
jgi:hypothetical protein